MTKVQDNVQQPDEPTPRGPSVFDFEAIRKEIGLGEDQAAFEGRARAATLEELLAETDRARYAYIRALEKADLLYFARCGAFDRDLALVEEEDLYRPAEALAKTAEDLDERIYGWVPDTVSEAIALLRWCVREGLDDSRIIENVLAWLCAIGPVAELSASRAPEPLDKDHPRGQAVG